jgi:RNA polymerase sigma factor (TIGR02999 family)
VGLDLAAGARRAELLDALDAIDATACRTMLGGTMLGCGRMGFPGVGRVADRGPFGRGSVRANTGQRPRPAPTLHLRGYTRPEPAVPPSASPPDLPGSWTESLYAELHALAAHQLRHQVAHTLQPTALVHEAWLRLARAGCMEVPERRSFHALAAKVMRSVLVDHARRCNALKRDAGERLELTTALPGAPQRPLDVLALDEAVEELERLDAELARIVELLLFGGLTAAEAAEVLDVSSRTVERGWRTARAFLQGKLGESS